MAAISLFRIVALADTNFREKLARTGDVICRNAVNMRGTLNERNERFQRDTSLGTLHPAAGRLPSP
jgi:hypothetical protein